MRNRGTSRGSSKVSTECRDPTFPESRARQIRPQAIARWCLMALLGSGSLPGSRGRVAWSVSKVQTTTSVRGSPASQMPPSGGFWYVGSPASRNGSTGSSSPRPSPLPCFFYSSISPAVPSTQNLRLFLFRYPWEAREDADDELENNEYTRTESTCDFPSRRLLEGLMPKREGHPCPNGK